VDGEDGDWQTIICKTKYLAPISNEEERSNWDKNQNFLYKTSPKLDYVPLQPISDQQAQTLLGRIGGKCLH